MRGRFDTIRARIMIGLALLLAGLIATAIAGAATLRQMRYAIEQELDALRTSTDVGSGLVTSVLEEIRAAEQYLGSPGDDPRRQFQAAAEDAFQHQRRPDALADRKSKRLNSIHSQISYAVLCLQKQKRHQLGSDTPRQRRPRSRLEP